MSPDTATGIAETFEKTVTKFLFVAGHLRLQFASLVEC